jgi:hypothetical protein
MLQLEGVGGGALRNILDVGTNLQIGYDEALLHKARKLKLGSYCERNETRYKNGQGEKQ